jgi:hypothetical protein
MSAAARIVLGRDRHDGRGTRTVTEADRRKFVMAVPQALPEFRAP